MTAERFDARAWGPGLTFAALTPGGWTPVEADRTYPRTDGRADWIVFAQADAFAAPDLEMRLRLAAAERPDVGVFYGDDAARTGDPPLRLKPSFNLALLAAQDYVGAPLFVRADLMGRLGRLRPEMGGAALYDLILRAETEGIRVERIPHVLLAYAGARPATPIEDRRRALRDWIGGRPLDVLEGRARETLRLERRFDDFPPVTLVVPTRQARPAQGGAPHVARLLDSLAQLDWPMDRLTVLVGDDSGEAATFAEGGWPFTVRRVETPRPPGAPFSYAAKMNRLWPLSETEHLVLLNDDVTITSPGWLRALMTFAMEGNVGGCGARLLFPDGRVQHAGMPVGLFGGVAHAWFGRPGDEPTYGDWALVHRDWSVVTGAVFATRRSVMELANGFDERFSIEFNDVDLALRLRMQGLRIVCTPFAEALHSEKSSRGDSPVAADQLAMFVSRWRDYIADDPAYHPGLTRATDVVAPAAGPPDWAAGLEG